MARESKTLTPSYRGLQQFKYLDILSAADEEEPEEAPAPKPEPAKKAAPQKKAPQKKAAVRKNQGGPPPEGAEGAQAPAWEEIEEPRTSLRTIRRALRTIVRENSDEDDWIIIGKIGNLLDKRYPDFDIVELRLSKLPLFLESLTCLRSGDMKKDGNSSPQKYVRLK